MHDSNPSTPISSASPQQVQPAWSLLPGPYAASMHSGLGIRQFFIMHVPGVVFPLAAGLFLYGWRALLLISAVLFSTLLGALAWRRIGARGTQMRTAHTAWLSLLLAMMLPAHLAFGGLDLQSPWPIIPAAGFLLATLIWLLGGAGSGRIHPVLITYLLLTVFFQQQLIPNRILQFGSNFLSDATDAPHLESASSPHAPWVFGKNRSPGHDALRVEPAAPQLLAFTSATAKSSRTWLTLENLIRDRMPPLEDFIIAGHPGPVGISSAIAIILGGLFLIYRGIIDLRIPLLAVPAGYLALLLLPIPVVITETAPTWRWLAATEHGIGWGLALTFANYQLMAGPFLFVAFFLATSPAIRPMTRRARAIYAVLLGIAVAASQLYVSVTWGPYAALLIVSILTPALDIGFRPRTLT